MAGVNERLSKAMLRQGLSVVARTWEREGRIGKSRQVPEVFALHSGRIGDETKLVAMGARPQVIKREGRWVSNALMTYVRANIEGLRWMSEVLSRENESK